MFRTILGKKNSTTQEADKKLFLLKYNIYVIIKTEKNK